MQIEEKDINEVRRITMRLFDAVPFTEVKGKETVKESLKVLSDVKPLAHSEQVEQDSCQLFNTSRFNDIVLAYLIIAMRTADTPQDEAMKLLDIFGHTLDEITAEQALARYRGNVQ